MLNLDDLPDLVLIEIICRLPRESAVVCRCVSKRWFSLLSSNTYFLRRFLCVQSENQKPISGTVIFTNPRQPGKFFSSEPPERKLSLSFLPCFQGSVSSSNTQPIVVGAYNDLVLCCPTMSFQRDYYICNPYTRQWDALPPAPRCHEEVRVGFISEPYYYNNDKNQQCDPKEEQVEEESEIRVNVEYRYRVVRIIPPKRPDKSLELFNMEMFSSETGRWTESVISCPRSFRFRTLCRDAGVAYNGMLYWWSSGEGFIIGLDPYEKSGKYCFRYIENKPTDERTSGPFKFLGVSSRGRLRMCQFTLADFDDNDGDVKVWELKDDHQMDMDVYRDVDMDMDVVAGNNGKWCLAGRVILRDMYRDNPLIKSWTRQRRWYYSMEVLAFDPNNEDILYLEIAQHIVMCNIREERLTEVSKTPYSYFEIHSAKPVFPFVFPWWPTPILTRHKSASSSSNSHLHRVTSTTRTRRAIKRMLQKQKEKPASACACACRRAIAKKKRTIVYNNHYFLI